MFYILKDLVYYFTCLMYLCNFLFCIALYYSMLHIILCGGINNIGFTKCGRVISKGHVFYLTMKFNIPYAAAGLCGDELERRAAYFHLLSWSLPFVLTITIIALAQVEADSVAGVCFLSSSIYIRIGFLLLPIIMVVIIGGFFLLRGK